jgi:hypothetical protein
MLAYRHFFFPLVFLCSPTGDHSQEDLAKFGNRPDMKVENFKNPVVFWLCIGNPKSV